MVDLRSDTLTMPDYPMLETILTARLGDDGRTDAKGRGERSHYRPSGGYGRCTGRQGGRYPDAHRHLRQHHRRHDRLPRGEDRSGGRGAACCSTEKFAFDGQLTADARPRARLPITTSRHMPDPDELENLLTESGASLIRLRKQPAPSPAATASTCPRWRLSARRPTDTASPSTWTVRGSSTQRPICTPR